MTKVVHLLINTSANLLSPHLPMITMIYYSWLDLLVEYRLDGLTLLLHINPILMYHMLVVMDGDYNIWNVNILHLLPLEHYSTTLTHLSMLPPIVFQVVIAMDILQVSTHLSLNILPWVIPSIMVLQSPMLCSLI